ncbi:hypothetical protein [Brucella pseudintermedia]|uniref:Uncharacterized protein n=2 Tax=Brucella/Ochrobactrum group TaxID=2826938 RepID=A0ABY5UG96_9HYPH|nr:hypothetical protein [Brucella pseudintermedia]KAB2681025.1 hypothetical protein F9K78_15635 [Brucella pseudintermedia]NKE75287.1 hypothetical protein [Ochrobactrum sp. MC-1LL]UWL61732.1 hypothetical protein NIK97_17780 [Brucella pseudintermedia]
MMEPLHTTEERTILGISLLTWYPIVLIAGGAYLTSSLFLDHGSLFVLLGTLALLYWLARYKAAKDGPFWLRHVLEARRGTNFEDKP